VTVRAVVIGAAPAHHVLLRYVLDGRRARKGPGHVQFQNLAPGRHRLVVTLAGNVSVKATSSFVVRQPPPAPASAPAPAPAPQPAPTPAPAPAAAPPPPPSNPIPQNNGGDQDSDNNGGPSDGDGNL
jgi:hypothetical protein